MSTSILHSFSRHLFFPYLSLSFLLLDVIVANTRVEIDFFIYLCIIQTDDEWMKTNKYQTNILRYILILISQSLGTMFLLSIRVSACTWRNHFTLTLMPINLTTFTKLSHKMILCLILHFNEKIIDSHNSTASLETSRL